MLPGWASDVPPTSTTHTHSLTTRTACIACAADKCCDQQEALCIICVHPCIPLRLWVQRWLWHWAVHAVYVWMRGCCRAQQQLRECLSSPLLPYGISTVLPILSWYVCCCRRFARRVCRLFHYLCIGVSACRAADNVSASCVCCSWLACACVCGCQRCTTLFVAL